MYCGKCNTEFGREPLIAYNGEWYCPVCLESLFPAPCIAVTFDNVSKYAESERLFHEGWLLAGNADALQRALWLCRQAAYEFHPNALIAMGYYHEKNYLNPFASESERVRSAYQYYKTVAAYDAGFRGFFLAGIAVPEANLKSLELQKLTARAMENILALVEETTEDAAQSVFRMGKIPVIRKLEELLRIENPYRGALAQESERFPTAAEFLQRIRADDVLFGFQKADVRLLRELGGFDGIPTMKELNADNFLQKLNVKMWIFRKDETWQSTEAGNKNEFLAAEDARAAQYVVAYWKKSADNVTHKNPKIALTCTLQAFDKFRLKLIVSGMLYDFRRDDLIVASKIVKRSRDLRREELFEAVLDTITNGGLQ